MTRTQRIAIIVASSAVVAGGAGVAIGATKADDARKTEDAILGDAAKRLDTTPQKLRDALAAAQDAQLDQAVKDGRITRAQADAMKRRRAESGLVLGRGPGAHGHFHLRRPGMPAGPHLLSDAAAALGITERQLMTRLHDGKTLAEIAKAEGKTLAEVKSAVVAGAKKRLDADVKAERITRAQADELLEHLTEHFDRFASGKRLRFRGNRPHHLPAPPEAGAFEHGADEQGAVAPAPVPLSPA